MKPKYFSLLLALALLPGSARCSQGTDVSRFEGRWEGAVVTVRGVQEGDIVVQFTANPDGRLVGLATLPVARVVDHPLTDVVAKGSQVSFIYKDDTGTSLVKVTLSPDGNRLEGDMEEKGKHYDIYFKRKPAPVLSQPVRTLSPDGHELREQFNRDADRVRLLVMLSPTCPHCLSLARLTERYLMEQVADPRLRLYVVWGPMQKDETEEAAREAALHLEDSRVIHYWTPSDRLIQSFSQPMNLKSPAYYIFFFFPKNATWTGELPPIGEYMHRFWYGRLPAELELDGRKMEQKVREMLARQ